MIDKSAKGISDRIGFFTILNFTDGFGGIVNEEKVLLFACQTKFL